MSFQEKREIPGTFEYYVWFCWQYYQQMAQEEYELIKRILEFVVAIYMLHLVSTGSLSGLVGGTGVTIIVGANRGWLLEMIRLLLENKDGSATDESDA